MRKLIQKTETIRIQKAIDIIAANPSMQIKEVAKEVGVSKNSISHWLKHPQIIERIYDRYMIIAGTQLPEVVQAIINEAKLGNVHAARLVLEHFGKLENKLKIQVESNFEKFMKEDDAEEGDFFEVTEDQGEVLDKLSDNQVYLPPRDPSNDSPKAKLELDSQLLKHQMARADKNRLERSNQADRYQIRKRAKKVGLELMPSGRHTRSERDEWMQKLEKLEEKSEL